MKKINLLTLLFILCIPFFTLGKVKLSESYTHSDVYMKLPLLFSDYDEVLSDYIGAKYIYPGSFSIDENNNVYIQYIFEPKQKDNLLVCYNNQGTYLGYYKIPNGGSGGAGEGVAVLKNEIGLRSVYVVSNKGVLQKYNLDGRFYGDSLLKEYDFPMSVYTQFSINNKYLLIESVQGGGKLALVGTNLSFILKITN